MFAQRANDAAKRGWDDAALGGALAIYDHPADLLDHLDELDLFMRELDS